MSKEKPELEHETESDWKIKAIAQFKLEQEHRQFIRSFDGKTMAMDEWLNLMKVSAKVINKLKEFNLKTIKLQGQDLPAIVSSTEQDYLVFFALDMTPDYDIEYHYKQWVRDHVEAIRKGDINFLFISDMEKKKFVNWLEKIGLKDNIIQRYDKKTFSRESMISRIQEMANKVQTLDLPVKIEKIYAFGSIFRKQRIGDVDLVVEVSQDNNSEMRLNLIHEYLTNNENQKSLIDRIYGCRSKYKNLRDIIVNEKSIHNIFESIGYPVDWLLCGTTLTTIDQGWNHPYPFLPDIEQIMIKAIRNKKQGFNHVLFIGKKEFRWFLVNKSIIDEIAKDRLLIWSPEHPNIKANIEGLSSEQFTNHLCCEFDKIKDNIIHFHDEDIIMTRDSSETTPPPVNPLENRNGNENNTDLIYKIEVLRKQLHNLKKRTDC